MLRKFREKKSSFGVFSQHKRFIAMFFISFCNFPSNETNLNCLRKTSFKEKTRHEVLGVVEPGERCYFDQLVALFHPLSEEKLLLSSAK